MNLIGKVINNKYTIIEKIGEGSMSTVWVAKDHTQNRNVAVKVLKKDVTSNRIEDVIRFRNDVLTISKLNIPGIAKIYEVGEMENAHYIIMEYLKEMNLHELIKAGKRLSVDETVKIIYKTCEALKCVHEANILHRNLKPGNIFIDNADGEISVKIADIGIAQIREFNIEDKNEIVETLFYMPPEQSGAIKRAVDERSDLYSLGVVFYQLLTNELPFVGDNINSIIYKHAAKMPENLTKINSNIPEIIEKMVLKLLEKEPENRYQHTSGLMRDIERYFIGDVNFLPGLQDKVIRLNYRTCLIGRDKELDELKKMFHKATKGTGCIAFINGEAGMGKTRLVEEFKDYTYINGGVFTCGKCFSGESKVPYGIFKDVINSYINLFTKLDEKAKKIIQNKIKESIGDLGRVILELNPTAEVILGECPEIVKLEPKKEIKRFNMVVCSFLCALGQIESPLVIMLDDVQWLDEGSINLIKELLCFISKYPVIIIGTCRNNEITKEHSLHGFITNLEQTDIVFKQINLLPFDKEQMVNFVSDILCDNGGYISEISDFILTKSKGNPFFSLEILKQLVTEKALICTEGKWNVDTYTLSKVEIPNTIIDILVKRISVLDDNHILVLSHAAAIGKKFDLEFLFALVDLDVKEIVRFIDNSIELKFLEQDVNEKGKILFVHDRIRDAFYSYIGSNKIKELHLKIAEIIERKYSNKMDAVVFDLAFHYMESGNKNKALEYLYPAANKAMESYSNEDSVKYFKMCSKLLEEKGEKGNKIWLECIRKAGLIRAFSGNFKEAIELLEQALLFEDDLHNKIEIISNLCLVYALKSEFKKALDYGTRGLLLLDKKSLLQKHSVIFGILGELLIIGLRKFFPGIQYESKKHTKDREKNILLANFLFSLLTVCQFNNNGILIIYMTLKVLNICENKIGKSKELALALESYGLVKSFIGKQESAVNLLKRSEEIAKELGEEYVYCVTMNSLGLVYQGNCEFEKSNEYFQKAISISERIGEYRIFVGSSLSSIANYLFLGEYKQHEKNLDHMIWYTSMDSEIFPKGITYREKATLSLYKGKFDDAEKYALNAYKLARGKNLFVESIASSMLGQIYIEKGDIDIAIPYLENSFKLNEPSSFMKVHSDITYGVITEAYIARYLKQEDIFTEKEKRKLLKQIRNTCKLAVRKTKKAKAHYARALRASAKYYALINKYDTAVKLFTDAIRYSIILKMSFETALGYYEYGLFLIDYEKKEKAKKYLEKAYDIFKDLDANLYIDRCMKILSKSENLEFDSTERFSQSIRYSQRISSIMSLNQQISSILDLEVLLNKIMEIALEATGAQNGYLIMKEDISEEIVVRISKSLDNESKSEEISNNIVHEVMEKGDPVIASDSLEDKVKSVLCIPIKYNNEIKGVCYLSNSLTSAVFVDEDIAILSNFMTQAAIAIENAKLYTMAITDGLTGLVNHKHFKYMLDKNVEQSKRYRTTFSLIMLDIDNFKSLNDTYGHQAGDEVLITLARLIKDNFRNIDVCARYGGEEFAIILPETDILRAGLCAERLRLAVENSETIYDGNKLKVTISLGISFNKKDTCKSDLMIKAADRALYKSKEDGRNMVTVLESDKIYEEIL